MPSPVQESGAPPQGDVVGLPEFILKNHSLLSIWFATPEEVQTLTSNTSQHRPARPVLRENLH